MVIDRLGGSSRQIGRTLRGALDVPTHAQFKSLESLLERQLKVLRSINDFAKENDRHVVADGLLQVFLGDRLVLQDETGLSVRASQVLRRAKFKMLSEISEEKLLGIRNCGVVTSKEICEWRDRVLSGSQRSDATTGEGS